MACRRVTPTSSLLWSLSHPFDLSSTTSPPSPSLSSRLNQSTTLKRIHPTMSPFADTTKRRRFQPPITSYFSPSPFSDSSQQDDFSPCVSHNHYSATTSSPTPVVSAKTQSNLLAAGMRVRKAIAEGYKTKASVESKPSPILHTTQHAELAPFCGFTKSGGGLNSTNSIKNDDGDAFSLPSSSQDSIGSVSSFTGVKRGYYDSDLDLDDDSILLDPAFHDSTTTTFARNDSMDGNTLLGRPIRNPCLARQRRMLSQQNRNMDTLHNGDMDVDGFEEAPFLASREEVDAEYF